MVERHEQNVVAMIKTGAEEITWTHVYPDGSHMKRFGVVWSEAQPCAGTSNAWWVIPDTHLDSDLYYVLLIGRNSAPKRSVNGSLSSVAHVSLARGELFASNVPSSPTGQAAAYARQFAQQTHRGTIFKAYLGSGWVR